MKFDITTIIFTIIMLILLIISINIASKSTDMVDACNDYWINDMKTRGCISEIDGYLTPNFSKKIYENNLEEDYKLDEMIYK